MHFLKYLANLFSRIVVYMVQFTPPTTEYWSAVLFLGTESCDFQKSLSLFLKLSRLVSMLIKVIQFSKYFLSVSDNTKLPRLLVSSLIFP